jgi:hypothetical protein
MIPIFSRFSMHAQWDWDQEIAEVKLALEMALNGAMGAQIVQCDKRHYTAE